MADDPKGAFRTHANYLRAFSMLTVIDNPIVSRRAALARLSRRVRSLASYAKLQRRDVDVGQLRRSLNHAWGTELVLGLPVTYAQGEDEIFRLANNWGVVQVYYVLYHATQALAVASGFARPENHQKTINLFSDRWTTKPVPLPPWSFGAQVRGFSNAPAQVSDSVHPWTACTPRTCWGLAGKALRTTRQELVAEAWRQERKRKQVQARKVWEEEERNRRQSGRAARKKPTFALPILTEAEKAAVAARLAPTCLMDYLWRLRVKAHYQDASVFIEGPERGESTSLYGHLRWLVSASLLVHELHVTRLVGRTLMTELVDQWLKRMTTKIGLPMRRDFILAP